MTAQEKYKKELLDKYLNKNLSDDERHELEKLALDDPFLFEALNGFAQAGKEHAQDISEIREKLLYGQAKKKRSSLVPYGIAASLLVVVGLSFWLTDIGDASSEKQMAEVETSTDLNTPGDVAEVQILDEADDSVESEVEESTSVTSVKKVAKEVRDEAKLKANEENVVKVNLENDPVAIQKAVKESVPMRSREPRDGHVPVANMPSVQQLEEESEISAEAMDADVILDEINNRGALEEAVLEEEVAAKKIESTPSASSANVKSERSKKANDTEEFPGAPFMAQAKSSLSPFDVHFIDMVRKRLTKREQKDINQNVELQFAIMDGHISEYKVVPSQGDRIDGILKEILESGSTLLPEQNALLIVYVIGF